MEILSFYTSVPQMTIIWCMVLEISSATDKLFVILGHFLPIFYHFAYEYHKSKSYDVWFLRYGVWQTEFFLILDHFLPFTPLPPLNNPKNQNFEKLKITPRDIITLYQKHTINDNHMINGPWDINCKRQIFLSS